MGASFVVVMAAKGERERGVAGTFAGEPQQVRRGAKLKLS